MNASLFSNASGWTIKIHPAKEGGFWGEVPAMPGCSSFGTTRAACRANVIEAAKGCLEVYFDEALNAIAPSQKAAHRSKSVFA